MKLAVFDFDSTLMDGETIDFLARELGIEQKVSSITQEAMSGRLDFFESLTQRVALLEGMNYRRVVEICESLPLMPGAARVVKELKRMDYKVICFSGGFTIATSFASEKINLDGHFSNTLHHKKDQLTGLVAGEMMFDFSKGALLEKLQSLLGVGKEDTLVCGDGANDRSMFKYADTKIAFCAHEVLKKEANMVIEKKDLTEILTRL